jgi:hypothetical protein
MVAAPLPPEAVFLVIRRIVAPVVTVRDSAETE